MKWKKKNGRNKRNKKWKENRKWNEIMNRINDKKKSWFSSNKITERIPNFKPHERD